MLEVWSCGVARAKESDAKSLDSEGKPGTAGCDTVAVAGGAGSAKKILLGIKNTRQLTLTFGGDAPAAIAAVSSEGQRQ